MDIKEAPKKRGRPRKEKPDEVVAKNPVGRPRNTIKDDMMGARTQRFLAETKFKELKIAQIEGRMVDRDQVVRDQVQRELEVKRHFMSIPKIAAQRLIGKGVIEIEAILTELIIDGCRKMANE
jgi:hypothetical protein